MSYTGNSWFYESAAEREKSNYVPVKSSFAPMQQTDQKLFDEQFEELHKHYKESCGIDIRTDLKPMLADKAFMEQYKTDLMTPIFEAFAESSPNDPHIQSICDNATTYWDTKVRNYNESVIANFLPISTLEFPVLTKQFFGTILKDIIEVESVKTPAISKHIRVTYMVNNDTGESYEYPKCLYDGTWEELYKASKGLEINPDGEATPLGTGLYNFDITSINSDATSGKDTLAWDFRIDKIQVGSDIIPLPGQGITVEFGTGGHLVNGNLNFTYDGTKIADCITGQVDFRNSTVSVTSASGQVTGVCFTGHFSNEKNLRNISVREERKIEKFTIEDGPRWNMPFSIEEIEDAAALLDMNYYNRMVDEIVKGQEMHENMSVIKFLMDHHDTMVGTETDTFNLEPTARNFEIDLQTPQNGFAGDPFKYISNTIQFHLKAFIHQITEATKLDDLSFVLVGNPMACQLIDEFTSWKSQSGTNIGGIKVNNSYGFSTDLGANIRVVASNTYDAYTAEEDEETGERELVLYGYGYPTDSEHISFRHLKFTSHLFTSQSQTAYQSPQAQGGGAYNIVTATSRFKTIAMQGISFKVVFKHSSLVYGKAPKRPPVVGVASKA